MTTFAAFTSGPCPERYTFSPAVRVGGMLFIAGPTATESAWRWWGRATLWPRRGRSIELFDALLAAAGGSLRDIVSIAAFITTNGSYRKTAEVQREAFGGPPYPTRRGRP